MGAVPGRPGHMVTLFINDCQVFPNRQGEPEVKDGQPLSKPGWKHAPQLSGPWAQAT